jgi:excisionase family DNA binding protein
MARTTWGIEEDGGTLLTQREAARKLGITKTTLWRLMHAGELPSIKVGGRRMVAPSDLAAFIARRRELRMVGRVRGVGNGGSEEAGTP